MSVLLDPNDLLAGLHPETLRSVRKLIRKSGATAKVRSARRSCAQQRDLYGIGRRYNTSSPPVTHADGCRSWHVLGRAVDLTLIDTETGSDVLPCVAYERLGVIWEEMGGVWGGRWKQFGPCGDAGHFEWHPGQKIEDVCPDPADCEQIEAQIDEEIARAHTMSFVPVVAFSVLLLGGFGAWYILRN